MGDDLARRVNYLYDRAVISEAVHRRPDPLAFLRVLITRISPADRNQQTMADLVETCFFFLDTRA